MITQTECIAANTWNTRSITQQDVDGYVPQVSDVSENHTVLCNSIYLPYGLKIQMMPIDVVGLISNRRQLLVSRTESSDRVLVIPDRYLQEDNNGNNWRVLERTPRDDCEMYFDNIGSSRELVPFYPIDV